MKKILLNTFLWIISLFSWFTISPLFYYLTWKWKLIGKKLRVTLLLISPIFLMAYIVLLAFGLDAYDSYQRKYRFTNKDTIERITGVTYPNFKIVEYTKGRTSFLGDYNDQLIIEFKETPSTAFYQKLDSLIAVEQSDWSKRDNVYSYSKIWGNGLPAPKGEDDEEDMTFSIEFEKGSKKAIIGYGAW